MCLQGLRATGLADFPHSVEEQTNSDRESSLPRVPQQISGRTALGPAAPDPHLGPCGCGWAKWEADPHSSNFTPFTHTLKYSVDCLPVWAALPGAGRSEELPGFAEVAGIDLALVAGLGRQEGPHGVRGGSGSHMEASGDASVVSNSVRPHRRQPTRLPRPRDSPGKNTGVGCHFLLQCMKVNSLSSARL